jgi:hypothetical protein
LATDIGSKLNKRKQGFDKEGKRGAPEKVELDQKVKLAKIALLAIFEKNLALLREGPVVVTTVDPGLSRAGAFLKTEIVPDVRPGGVSRNRLVFDESYKLHLMTPQRSPPFGALAKIYPQRVEVLTGHPQIPSPSCRKPYSKKLFPFLWRLNQVGFQVGPRQHRHQTYYRYASVQEKLLFRICLRRKNSLPLLLGGPIIVRPSLMPYFKNPTKRRGRYWAGWVRNLSLAPLFFNIPTKMS